MNSELKPQLRDEAADWVVQLGSAGAGREAAALRAACDAWRARSAEHERLFVQCQQLWQAVEPAPRTRRRRPAVGAACAVLLIVAASQLPWRIWTADVRAPSDGIRELVLDDGSRLTLNRGAAVDLDFDAQQRRVYLREGELLAEVAHDATRRPFRVIGRDGVAEARGTRYLVRVGDDDTRVTVLESVVGVSPALAAAQTREVHAGEELRFDARQIFGIAPAPVGADAWTQRRLVFTDAPLADVVAALAAHRRGWLRLAGDGAEQLRFTGVLPADDPDAALALLQRALPLQTRSLTPYLVWVEPRT